jgi:hypothetical protein
MQGSWYTTFLCFILRSMSSSIEIILRIKSRDKIWKSEVVVNTMMDEREEENHSKLEREVRAIYRRSSSTVNHGIWSDLRPPASLQRLCACREKTWAWNTYADLERPKESFTFVCMLLRAKAFRKNVYL